MARAAEHLARAQVLIWLLSVKRAHATLCKCRCEQEGVAGPGTRRILRLPPVKDHEPARAGFVDHMQSAPLADELAQRLVQPEEVPADASHVSNLAIAAGTRRGDVDAALAHVRSDVQSARFLNGPSPRKFATTRPPAGPLHWCSSARLRRATYVVAGDGPPEFTKPS